MIGQYVGSYSEDGTEVDHGYLFEEARYTSSFLQLEEYKKQDEAYVIKVYESENRFDIVLESENREIESEMGKQQAEKLFRDLDGRRSNGPGMPTEYSDPNKALEIYGEFALEDQDNEGIVPIERNWQQILDEENLGDNDFR